MKKEISSDSSEEKIPLISDVLEDLYHNKHMDDIEKGYCIENKKKEDPFRNSRVIGTKPGQMGSKIWKPSKLKLKNWTDRGII